MNEWTLCKQRLPSKSGDYLVTTHGGKLEIKWYNHIRHGWQGWIEPLAWVELPKPYKPTN